jgi:hypothetical protein
MNMKKFLAGILTAVLLVAMLPSMIFAAESTTVLSGQLQLQGIYGAGSDLRADYSKVNPSGLTDDDVTFQWSRMTPEELEWLEENPDQGSQLELPELGTKSSYTLQESDVGYHMILVVTGREEMGVTGSLTVISKTVVTEEEAQALPADDTDAALDENIVVIDELEAELVSAQDEGITEDPESDEIYEDEESGESYTEEPYTDDDSDMIDVTIEEEYDSLSAEDEGSDSQEDTIYSEPEDSYTEEEYPQEETEDVQAEPAEASEQDEILESPVEPSYIAEAQTEDGSGVLDFGDIAYEDLTSGDVAYQTVTVTNIGESTLSFTEIAPEHFMVQDIVDPLLPGESVSLWVQPREGLDPGIYEDVITYVSEEGAEAEFTAVAVVLDPVEEVQEPDPAEDPDVDSEVLEELNGLNEELMPASEPGEEPDADSVEDPEEEIENSANELEQIPQEAVEDPEEEPGEEPAEEPGEEPKAEPAMTVTSSSLTFSSVQEGYESVAAQTLSIANSGNVTLKLLAPASDCFDITLEDGVSGLGDYELEAGSSVDIQVSPKAGLAKGDYTETISFGALTDSGEEAPVQTVTVSFSVTEKEDTSVKLQSIVSPERITGLAYGTAKDAASLKLPSVVTINTTSGQMNAQVAWDVASSAYDPSSTSAQNFSVNGTVTLPEGVTNPENISLNVSVNVSVSGYTAKTADPAQNQISGISGKYTTSSRISFTAIGAGMDNSNPKSGDTRYIPESWSVVNRYNWEKSPYTASFGMAKAGTYTLSVTFKQQKYNGSAWADTGVEDQKSVAFTVEQAAVTPTAVPGQSLTPAAQKTAVETGDTTPILPLVIVLVVAIAAIAGVIVYRSKRK